MELFASLFQMGSTKHRVSFLKPDDAKLGQAKFGQIMYYVLLLA